VVPASVVVEPFVVGEPPAPVAVVVAPEPPPAPVPLVAVAAGPVAGVPVPEEQATLATTPHTSSGISALFCKFSFRIFTPSFVHHSPASRSAKAAHEKTP
jgi:hypothetical protein